MHSVSEAERKSPMRRQALAQLKVIVDLAVVGDHGRSGRRHRLVRRRAQIDDREPAMAEAQMRAVMRRPGATPVRTAMRNQPAQYRERRIDVADWRPVDAP